MRRRTPRLLVLTLALIAAALLPGAAVFVEEAHACSPVYVESPVDLVPNARVIVIGEVTQSEWMKEFTYHVEAYLKGPAVAADLTFHWQEPVDNCGRMSAQVGDRVLMFFGTSPPDPRWPSPYEHYEFRNGKTLTRNGAEVTEDELVRQIRSITGQYAVPAANADDGATIDWVGTVLPVTAALLVVFGIGLLLMRTWHRIDPS